MPKEPRAVSALARPHALREGFEKFEGIDSSKHAIGLALDRPS